jgi:hypothetical protein
MPDLADHDSDDEVDTHKSYRKSGDLPDLTDQDSDNGLDTPKTYRKTLVEIESEFTAPVQDPSLGKRKYTFKKRKPRVQAVPKRDVSTQPDNAFEEAGKDVALLGRCRHKCCLSGQATQLKSAVLEYHHEFCAKSGGDRNEWLGTIMVNVNLDVAQPFKGHIAGISASLCKYCFQHLHGIPKNTINDDVKRARAGVKRTLGGDKGGRSASNGTAAASLLTTWLKWYAEATADGWPCDSG